MFIDWYVVETERVFMDVKMRPTLVLWAGDINYMLDHQHIVWLDVPDKYSPVLNYGYLDPNNNRVPLASYDGTNVLVNEDVKDLYTTRMIATLRFLWHRVLFTPHPQLMYRWHKIPEQLEEAQLFHKRMRGTRRTDKWIYGSTQK